MKLRFTVEIENEDGSKTVEPIVIDTDIPEFEEYTSPEKFREVFHECEKAVLKARNTAAQKVIEEYLTELSKKKSVVQPKDLKKQS